MFVRLKKEMPSRYSNNFQAGAGYDTYNRIFGSRYATQPLTELYFLKLSLEIH